MKWLLPIGAATCAAALVAVLALALPATSSPTRGDDDALHGASPSCIGEPSWFAPIHKAYDCNPRITPDFDFASLYSAPPETVPSSQALRMPR
jgi:hypothetical protein